MFFQTSDFFFYLFLSSVDCLPQSRPRNAAEAFPVISRKQPVLQTSTFHIPREYLFLSKHRDTVNSLKGMSQYECQCFLKNLLTCVSFFMSFSCGILSWNFLKCILFLDCFSNVSNLLWILILSSSSLAAARICKYTFQSYSIKLVIKANVS